MLLQQTVATQSGSSSQVVSDADQWDGLVLDLGGQLHQTWRWGAFKALHGWEAERIVVEDSSGRIAAQILFRRHGPLSTAFIPMGPVAESGSPRLFEEFWTRVNVVSRAKRAVHLVIEPDRVLPSKAFVFFNDIEQTQNRHTPRRTVIISLGSDADMMASMHPSKRREVRKCSRRGVQIEVAHHPEAVASFYKLLKETATRNAFRINSQDYYASFLETMCEDAELLLARADERVVAGLVIARAGESATYVFGASSTVHRVSGASAYLQFAAMQWARNKGCEHYDLWGIPVKDPSSYIGPDGRPIRSQSSDDAGLYRFKTELGGEILSHPPGYEVCLQPVIWGATKRLKDLKHAFRR